MKNISLFVVLLLALIASCLGGCASPVAVDRLIAIEAEKVSRIQLGMSLAQVQNIMGTEMLNFGSSFEARPIRTDKFMSKDGAPMEIYYYRSSIKDSDGICSDDETTAVILVNGKVDVITSGDTSKTVIEVRRR